MKKKLIVANWKLNGNKKMIFDFFKYLKSFSLNYLEKNIIVIAPPDIYLDQVQKNINDINIHLCAQNVDLNLKGAFTGETSILMLKDLGVKYVIVGHSERRLFHHETNNFIAKKFHLIKKHNLIPILCVGETEKDKKNGKTEKVIEEQLNCVLKKSGKLSFNNTVIAYEPIWAIGTGLSAIPEEVQLIHKFIKNHIEKHDESSIDNITIQYGGSVNSSNAKEFLQQEDINGLLIGGASLNSEEFFKIIKTSFNIFYE